MSPSMHRFEGPASHSFELLFELPAQVVWGLVSDTDRLNALTGLPQVKYQDEAQEGRLSRRTFSFELDGFPILGEEFPSSWERHRYYEVNRHYMQGFVSDLRHRCELERVDRGSEPPACRARFLYWMRARDAHGEAFKAAFDENVMQPLRGFLEAAGETLASALAQETLDPESIQLRTSRLLQAALRDPGAEELQRVQALTQDADSIHPSDLNQRIADLVLFDPDFELRRIRPLELARKWQVPIEQLLPSFLASTQAGLLSLKWDLVCPHCRGGQDRMDGLEQVAGRARCVPCGIDFDVELSRALEAVFVPHPQLREIEDIPYCMAGPSTRPHVLYQSPVEPGATYHVELALSPGRYRLRCEGAEGFRWLRVLEPSDQRASDARLQECSIEQGRVDGPDLVVVHDEHMKIEVHNACDQLLVAVVEDPTWANDALVAADLLTHHKFRDLFSHEMLAHGVSLSVSSVTILFTDLVGSTAMYGELGDARAFGLVWAHFELLQDIVARSGGATVKTIGDAVMAAFSRPEDSLKAASMLHREIGPFLASRGFEYPVSLKVGIHTGASIAVTLNERMDYFGGTVNLAARVESKSEGGDILVSPHHAKATHDCAFLRKLGWSSQNVLAHLKGFDEPMKLLRFLPPETVAP
ncbi:MAG: hypothetical protein CL558_06165 [Alphaproteobacteria bacterium]|nr:hypothetical protein [Alphaproteobacteria bacterium]